MAKSFDWYRGLHSEMIDNDAPVLELFNAIDDMFHGVIELDESLQERSDIRLVKDSTPHDAIYNGAAFLANSKVRFDITPLGTNKKEIEKANKFEESLDWHWDKSNGRGQARKIFDIAHSALRYDLAVTRVDDLDYWLPKDKSKWTKENKRAARGGRFPVTIENPKSVHFHTSGIGGVYRVLFAKVVPLSEIVDYYTGLAGANDEGKRILSAIEKAKKIGGDDWDSMNFMLYDYTDDEKRLVYGYITDVATDTFSEVGGEGSKDIIFIDGENNLPFIPYTIRGGASEMETMADYKYHPMLASAHWHGLWSNAVLAKSLAFSDIIRRVMEPRRFYYGSTTDQVPPQDGTGADVALPPGTQVQNVGSTSIDPQMFQVIQDFASALSKTTGTSVLSNLSTISASTPFSSINAQIQLAEGNMNPQRNIIQDTIGDIAYLMCEWVKHTKSPLLSWRGADKKVGDKLYNRGEEIQISDKDYDLARLFIKCSITPEKPTDNTQRINNARLMNEMGLSRRDALESLNVPHPEQQMDMWLLEKLKEGKIQSLVSKMMAEAQSEVQIKTQKAMMEMQQAAQEKQAAQAQAQQQAAQQPQQGAPPSPFDGMGGAGFDPAAGGQPPIQGAPGMGREQVQGTTANGQDLAA